MIIVLSYDDYEQGTDPVIDWLLFYKAEFIKVTIKDFYQNKNSLCLDIAKKRLYINGSDVTDRVKVIFYRRLLKSVLLTDSTENNFKSQLEKECTDELQYIMNFLFLVFKDKVWLPSPYMAFPNKLTISNTCETLKVRTPKSIITNNKSDLIKFYNECSAEIITKPVNKSSYFIDGEHTYFAHVNSLNLEQIKVLPDLFFPSLFQEKISKDYEIRSFFIDGDFYSVSMLLSGPDKGIDIKRNFDNEFAHWVNYKLPNETEKNLRLLMEKLNLNTGSLDIIKNKNGEYYFIEVNPVGQYGSPSYLANYNLEKVIAQWLIKKS